MIPFAPQSTNPFIYFLQYYLQYFSEDIAFVAAFIVGFGMYSYINKKKQLHIVMPWMFLYLTILGVFVSRAWYFIDNWEGIWTIILFFDVTKPGLVSVGMMTGMIIGNAVYVWHYEGKRGKQWLQRYAHLADEAIFSFGICVFIFRAFGCFLYGDVVGTVTTVPWALQLADGSLRHPTALYLSFYGLLLFCFTITINKIKKWNGQTLISTVALYLFGRFIWDFFRVTENFMYTLSFIQVFSFVIVLLLVPLYIIIDNNYKK